MLKNKIILILIFVSQFNIVMAQDKSMVNPSKAKASQVVAKDKKKISLDFEEELVKGVSDAPDVMFLNTRKAIKYNELYDLRTNFIQEIELNRGIFDEIQK